MKFRELWRYDLGRQATIAFGAGFVVIGVMMAVIIASTPSFRAGVSTVDKETAELSGKSRGRYLAEREARRQAEELGAEAAARDLPGLLATGEVDEAYELAYDHAWNDVVQQLSRQLPRQLLARDEGTQWIELLR